MKLHSTIDDFIWPNRYLLSFLGFWPIKSKVTIRFKLFAYFRMTFTIFVMLTLIIPEILTITIFWGDISVLAGVGCIAITAIQFIFKFLYMVMQRQKFCYIYETARKLWPVINDNKEKECFENIALSAKRCTIVFFIAALSNVVLIITASILICVQNYLRSNDTSYTRNLPFDIWYGVDTQRTPYFEIIFCSQAMAVICGAVGVVGFDSTMMTLILHMCGQFRLLYFRLYSIGERIEKEFYHSRNYKVPRTNIGLCIKQHQSAIRFAKEIKALLSPVIFVQLMTSGVELCLSGYALIMGAESNNNVDISRFLVYVVTIFLQLVIWCWPGELLIQESEAIANCVLYELPWQVFSASEQRDLSFIIFRAQRACEVTALNFQVMSLKKLTEVFNAAASYFALLRSVGEGQTK